MWKNVFKEGQELVVSTCSVDGTPHANIVISRGFVDDKLLFADAQMGSTLINLKNTNEVCIIGKNKELYIRIKGVVEIFSFGKYFDICNNADKEYPTKNAILVTINEVFDLDKVQVIK